MKVPQLLLSGFFVFASFDLSIAQTCTDTYEPNNITTDAKPIRSYTPTETSELNAYYIDPVNGNDGSAGTKSSPWKSLSKIKLVGQPGHTFFLLNGTYGTVATGAILYLKGLNGTAANPINIRAAYGAKPVFNPNKNGEGIRLLECSYLNISGITVVNAYGNEGGGIGIKTCNAITLSGMEVYDTDGVDNNNVSGLHILASTNIEVAYSSFHDNYDRTAGDTGGITTENSTNIVVFLGGNITIHDCQIYQTKLALPTNNTGGGLKYKHASNVAGAVFHVYNNVFRNCKFQAFGSGTSNTNFHHNIIISGAAGTVTRDFGGTTSMVNQTYEYNTFYNVAGPTFTVNPSSSYPLQNIVFRNNIVYETFTNYGTEVSTVNIGTYMSDALYNSTAPQLSFSNNCYYNPNHAVQLNIGAANNGGSFGTLGGKYTLAQWKALGYGYDASSINQNPLFVDPATEDFRLGASSPCTGMGARHSISILKNFLASGETMSQGEQIKSPNGHYRLTLQGDGNLVLYNNIDVATWSSDTQGNSQITGCTMQSDGNLILRDASNVLYQSETAGNPGAYLTLDNNGDAVIYKNNEALWRTSTQFTTTVTASISPTLDLDWFTFFTPPSAPNFRVRMQNLVTDFDLEIFDQSGTKILNGYNDNTNDENVVYNTNNTTDYTFYKVKVHGYGGNHSTQCYTLSVTTSFPDLTPALVTSIEDEKVVKATQFFPNPALSGQTVFITLPLGAEQSVNTIRIVDLNGILVSEQKLVSNDSPSAINLQGIEPGIYILDAGDAGKQKLVVQ